MPHPRRVQRPLLLCLLWVGLSLGAAAQSSDSKQVEAAIARVYPALVQLHVVTVAYHGGREIKGEAVGSGVVISSDGYIVTNHHVAGDARRIRVRFVDRREVEARLVGTDALSDLSVVKVDPHSLPAGLVVPQFGDSDRLRVGDRVLAMGCPAALSQSVTSGIVSNVELVIPSLYWPMTFTLDGEDVGSLVKWIGHDAPIHPGNSGGPLVNLDGQIVGINEISLGLSGAIPSNLVRDVCAQLIASGTVHRSWLGLVCQPRLSDEREKTGAMVAEVTAASPAARAGLRPGDVLMKLKGEPVSVLYAEDMQVLNRRMFSLPLGVPVAIDVERDGKPLHLEVTPIARESMLADQRVLDGWGMSVRDVTPPLARELERDDDHGVLVDTVSPSGAAGNAHPPLQSEDIIVRVDRQPVRNVNGLTRQTAALRGRHADRDVLVEVERNGEHLLSVVKLGESHEDDPIVDVKKAWAPLAWQVLTSELAHALGLDGQSGIVVTEVFGTVPQIHVGDVITKVDNDPIAASHPEDSEVFSEMIRAYKIGSRVHLTLLDARDHKPRVVTLTLGTHPPQGSALRHYHDADCEFEVRETTLLDETHHRDAAPRGVYVDDVQSGGWAALAHLAVGDRIVALNGTSVGGLGDFERRLKSIEAVHARSIVLFVQRDAHTHFIEIQPTWQ